ncbi:hypothetical protein NCAS_0F01270 [Naumovozyma castellii]|uniref:Extracellular mutant protein 11 C-terminal domain-containing protein n=1 Tax=Naumovozyma castellii TaxID=27288 RepID=G0VGJ0_NAUCA|nr:hypothetical protein NCAS_0F01270 [Naumovozyma castellii CBS 4309]CCC70611.1 hypothetical protein NCAS_0F01270 [Naumovozyma castellii CBS 4309]
MTIIKTESNCEEIKDSNKSLRENLFNEQVIRNGTTNSNGSDSRPAQIDKEMDKNSKEERRQKNSSKKKKLATFLLNTKDITMGGADKDEIVIKQEPDAKDRTTTSQELSETTEKKRKRKLLENESASSTKSSKKLNVMVVEGSSPHKEKLSSLKENRVPVKKNNDLDVIENPGEYPQINKLLYESSKKEPVDKEGFMSVLPGVEQEDEINFGIQVCNWSLDEWIECGQHLHEEYGVLVTELIKQRIELSVKFEVVTSVINQRAEALNCQGKILDDKLIKIKELGKEILNII